MEEKKDKFLIWFKDLSIEDTPLVGGKNAALGEMYGSLTKLGINIPNGFALTSKAYWHFLNSTDIKTEIENVLAGLDHNDIPDLQRRGEKIRQIVLEAELPQDLKDVIKEAYLELSKTGGKDVAVRSSATAEDLPTASFAGQQETFLNVRGVEAVVYAAKRCIASLFTNRAISYRADQGFPQTSIALSVGVQKMIRSDKGASGVNFTIDPETGLKNIIYITSTWGLGETIVQGRVEGDQFYVFKDGLKKGFRAIVSKRMGSKERKLVYDEGGGKHTKEVSVEKSDREKFTLSDDEIIQLAKWSLMIEEHFTKQAKEERPMDIEWAKDGITGEIFIVQARPETVQSQKNANSFSSYYFPTQPPKKDLIVTGDAIGSKIAYGSPRIIKGIEGINQFRKGEILVTEMTDPDWEPIMKEAAAIITNKGGRTSHAAIVSRELGIPAVVGTGNATELIKDGSVITVDCSSPDIGKIYKGKHEFSEQTYELKKIPKTETKLMLNIGSPDQALIYHSLPVQGVGLAREEFIIASEIKIHPMALIQYEKIKSEAKSTKSGTNKEYKTSKSTLKKIVKDIDGLTRDYSNKKEYYIDKLASGVAKIGVAFWPRPVIVRFSDFKTNEYRTLIGGEIFEPAEENPMIGWRGASRYYSPKFEEAFGLEVKAIKRVREEIGLDNVNVMVPFCRTPEEGNKVVKLIEKYGLERKNLKVYVMCEIPSNVIQAYEFLEIFDGFSIGSNDLAQLTLGIDRDNATLSGIANENNDSVKELVRIAISVAREQKKYSGICGQAPSDFPDFAEFLVKNKIESISLNPDTVVPLIEKVAKWEKKYY
jgi:pyruvate,water dikinase